MNFIQNIIRAGSWLTPREPLYQGKTPQLLGLIDQCTKLGCNGQLAKLVFAADDSTNEYLSSAVSGVVPDGGQPIRSANPETGKSTPYLIMMCPSDRSGAFISALRDWTQKYQLPSLPVTGPLHPKPWPFDNDAIAINLTPFFEQTYLFKDHIVVNNQDHRNQGSYPSQLYGLECFHEGRPR